MNFKLEIDDITRRKVCRECGAVSAPVPVRSASAHAEALQQAELDGFERKHVCPMKAAA